MLRQVGLLSRKRVDSARVEIANVCLGCDDESLKLKGEGLLFNLMTFLLIRAAVRRGYGSGGDRSTRS